MHKIEDLKIWKKSMELTKSVYKICAELPSDERFGLVSQIKRCAVSIPSNIAEGAEEIQKKKSLTFYLLPMVLPMNYKLS
jgi:four helix bundle protein